MTRQQTVAKYWCVISEVLHLGPREQDRLTVYEFDQAVAYVKQRTEKHGNHQA